MPSVLPIGYESRVKDAVRAYWQTLENQEAAQAAKQAAKAAKQATKAAKQAAKAAKQVKSVVAAAKRAGQAAEEAAERAEEAVELAALAAPGGDRGNRSKVTGGKQMDGFARLVTWLVTENGMSPSSIYCQTRLELPGFFRATKKWDLLVIHRERLVAAVEFKSQAGPSFGNNLNNRTEESLGTSLDLATAYREGAFGQQRAPWVGWLTLIEDCKKSNTRVKTTAPNFPVRSEFEKSSYAMRWELLLRKLELEKHYTATAFLMATREGGLKGEYREPASDLGMKPFLARLGGHIQSTLAIL